MKNKSFSKIIIFLIILQLIASTIYEGYSGIEQLTYQNDEIFLNAYYFTNNPLSEPKDDIRNGIKIGPMKLDDDDITDVGCGFDSTPLEFDNKEWNYEIVNMNSFFPPTYNLIASCKRGNTIKVNLNDYINKDIEYKPNDFSYIFYFWIIKNDNSDSPINVYCDGSPASPITFSFPSSPEKGFYQLHLKYLHNFYYY